MPDIGARELSGWGRTSSSWAHAWSPSSVADVAAAVRGAGPRGLLARGFGNNYGDAAQNAGGVVVLPIAPMAPIDFDPETGLVRVSAGTTLARLLHELLPLGRTLPVLPGTGQVTVGGAIAADVHGKNHQVHGSFGQWTCSLELVDGLGELRHVRSPDPAFRATVGGMGLTGVIVSAVLQTRPVQSSRMRVRTRRLASLSELMDAMDSSSATYQVAWVDATTPSRFGRGLLEEAEHEDSGLLTNRQPTRRLSLPRLPVNIVQPALTRQCNRAWWLRMPPESVRSKAFSAFFHPLDAVKGWPGLYGPHGLLQWQFVIPDDARAFVSQALWTLADTSTPPALVVLKRMGAGRAGHLSFPMPGWSLAVDLPAHPNVGPVLDRLDSILSACGGRVYLAKDTRLARPIFEQMYPELDEWRAVRHGLDPHGVFTSDLGRRLGLSG